MKRSQTVRGITFRYDVIGGHIVMLEEEKLMRWFRSLRKLGIKTEVVSRTPKPGSAAALRSPGKAVRRG